MERHDSYMTQGIAQIDVLCSKWLYLTCNLTALSIDLVIIQGPMPFLAHKSGNFRFVSVKLLSTISLRFQVRCFRYDSW
ncbi:hypothetical protein M413DRAFT_129284 [Hebeloma cylindrosporum]|uniref:Uncharacterized protein n=1 Tax=Hebeloma cylindrosporum TaxID=76867 RepID=A0A0C2XX42_HEBCY|nr:hypothetical protein M413DRAFT_129284 [Hebeloma cylindrosporum h7]